MRACPLQRISLMLIQIDGVNRSGERVRFRRNAKRYRLREQATPTLPTKYRPEAEHASSLPGA